MLSDIVRIDYGRMDDLCHDQMLLTLATGLFPRFLSFANALYEAIRERISYGIGVKNADSTVGTKRTLVFLEVTPYVHTDLGEIQLSTVKLYMDGSFEFFLKEPLGLESAVEQLERDLSQKIARKYDYVSSRIRNHLPR